MRGDIKHFRREVLGGFDRRDVIEYIKQLARERDRYRGAAERMESQLQALDGEAEKLRGEIRLLGDRAARLRVDARVAEIRAREIETDAYDSALRDLEGIEERYASALSDIDAIGERIREDLAKVDECAALMSGDFNELGEHFDRLRRAVTAERARLDSVARMPRPSGDEPEFRLGDGGPIRE
jgi:chromosome segregation ATPase